MKKIILITLLHFSLNIYCQETDNQWADHFFKEGKEAFDKGYFFLADTKYTSALLFNPNCIDAYNNRGLAKLECKNYAGAISDFDKEIEINSKPSFYLYYNRGLAKAKLGDHLGAIVDFCRVVILNPSYANAYTERGVSKGEMDDNEGEILDYTEAIRLNPKDTKAYVNRGIAKFMLNQKESGCLDLNKARELGDIKVYEMIQKYCN